MERSRSIDKISLFALLISFFIFSFLAASLVATSSAFFLGYSTSPSFIIFGLLTGIVIGWIGVKKYFRKHSNIIFGILIISIIVMGGFSFLINRWFFDTSSDGQTYHTSGVLELANGWNPFLDKPLPVTLNPLIYYVNYYPKGIWILGALIYKITGHIDDSKTVNLIILIGSFFLCFSSLLMLGKLKPLEALLLSILINFNPVTIYQLFCLLDSTIKCNKFVQRIPQKVSNNQGIFWVYDLID